MESNDEPEARRNDASVVGIARFGELLTARALIRSSGQILVLRPDQAGWSLLPGGRIEPGNPVQSTLVGHVAQQTGLLSTIIGFVGGVEHHHARADAADHAITLVFEARLSDSHSADHTGNRETEWVAADDLVGHDLRPVALKEALIEGSGGPFWRAWTQ
ncbi:NUDIX domain-containing protein [Promicromonospora sp. NPDC057138]|uniref:NUDIX domain-containing protein n=1 Tax=Promicromonospora sp. NPDC057138 TaxID=3346031 RepID=UPI003629B16A